MLANSLRTPRLFSLTTVGIIYHGNCNYPLHHECTSFAGDSGSGKSTIADLLQLIFVGPREYRSATQSQDARPINGLVLGDGGRGGVAYALVNVALPDNRFVAMGCYQAAATGECYPFLVYQDYSDSKLEPFSQPLTYDHFLVQGQILPYDEWKRHLDKQFRLTARVFTTHFAEYHRILFKNQLLPLDLSGSALATYASILRTFSRSGELERTRYVDYHDFLFGKEAHRQLLERYNKLVKELAGTTVEQTQYRASISQTRQMLIDFRELLRLRTGARKAEEAYLLACLEYSQWQIARSVAAENHNRQVARQKEAMVLHLEAERANRELSKARDCVTDYVRRENLQKIHKQCQAELDSLKKQQRALADERGKLTPQLHEAQKVSHWLKLYGPHLAEVRAAQKEQQSARDHRRTLEALKDDLAKQGLLDLFSRSVWSQGLSVEAAMTHLRELHEQVEIVRQTSLFADLEEPDSLAGWALARGKPLTLEEESVLARFRTRAELANCAEESGHQYLTDPEALLANLRYRPANNGGAGFWLDLISVCEWIEWVPTRAFHDANGDRIRALFAKRKGDVEEQLTRLEARLTQERRIQELVQAHAAWEALPRYPVLRIQPIVNQAEELPDYTAFEAALALFDRLPELSATEARLTGEFEQVAEEIDGLNKVVGAAQSQIEQINQKLADSPKAALYTRQRAAEEIAQTAQNALETALAHLQADYPADYAAVVAAQQNSTGFEGEAFFQAVSASRRAVADAETAAQAAAEERRSAEETLLRLAADFSRRWPDQPLPQPPQAEAAPPVPDDTAYRTADTAYRDLFSKLVGRYAGTGANANIAPDELGLFMQRVVPAGVQSLVESEEAVVDELDRYLNGIIDKNNALATSRLNKLRELLEELDGVIDQQINEVQRIQHYLRTGDTAISGNFRPILHFDVAEARRWVRHFGRALNNRSDEGLDELLAEDDIPALMRRVYRQYEKRLDRLSDQQTTPEKLLNPKTYLDIRFRMAAASGEGQNSGSTGQTFMAAALLNVARLSVIGQGTGTKARPGIRFMAIDEAHGLGSNYTTLVREARRLGYQIITLSVEPVVSLHDNDQTIYFLGLNPDPGVRLNLPPMMLRHRRVVPLDDSALTDYWGPLANNVSVPGDAAATKDASDDSTDASNDEPTADPDDTQRPD